MSDESLKPIGGLCADAWCGEPATGALDEGSLVWGLRRDLPSPRQKLAPEPVNLANWLDPRVGWGVVLRDRDDMSGADKAMGADAPEPIQKLLVARAPAPVLRYRPDLDGRLRRYDAAGIASEPSFNGQRGSGPNAIPYYLLIVGSPIEIPWSAQYRMQTDAFVGRLDLDTEGLEHYVEALLGDWGTAVTNAQKPLIWAVDHGFPDITRLMRKCIAERLQERFVNDPDHEFDMREGFISDAMATRDGLRASLLAREPAFILTSSHGSTSPLDDAAAMRGNLGVPVDHAHQALSVPALAGDESGHGAIWYAHACCSAGADATSKFEGIVGAGSSLGRTLAAVAKVGACTAPLPRALLGRSKPLRAFIGHVEPTFDWTLRDPATGQVTTHHIVDTLYNQLHLLSRPPIGLAMSVYFRAVAGLLQDHLDAVDGVDQHQPNALERARRAKLFALDRLAMVLLGDPTVSLPQGLSAIQP